MLDSPYIPVVQASMMGKSRLFHELPNSGVFVFYMCLYEYGSDNFPQACSELAGALINPSCTEGYFAAFLLAALDKLRSDLSENPGLTSALWFQGQRSNCKKFWTSILGKNAHPRFY